MEGAARLPWPLSDLNCGDFNMDELLRQLLNQFERIGQSHPEIYERECREAVTEVVFKLFVQPEKNYHPELEFGIRNRHADLAIRNALLDYCAESNNFFIANSNLDSFRTRLLAFQNDEVQSDFGYEHSDFFIWVNPYLFDERGNIIFNNVD